MTPEVIVFKQESSKLFFDHTEGIGTLPAVESKNQELLGHRDVRTAMVYTHVLNKGGKAGRSALDTMQRN